ncbi:MAG: hypothetical protein GX660_23165 [Clostridiaceae bacterium]|nr:hypothetical protein [Clostridiaceae bacterium]
MKILTEAPLFAKQRGDGGEFMCSGFKFPPSPNLPLAHSSRLVFGVLSTVGYLLDESGQESVLKDPDMLKRLNDIAKMEKEDKNHILYAIDGLIKSVKLKNIAAL